MRVPLWPRLVRATLYGFTIFLSFFLMLVFMTYNVSKRDIPPCIASFSDIPMQAYLILAVVLGAALGHFIYGRTIDLDSILAEGNGKTMACH